MATGRWTPEATFQYFDRDQDGRVPLVHIERLVLVAGTATNFFAATPTTDGSFSNQTLTVSKVVGHARSHMDATVKAADAAGTDMSAMTLPAFTRFLEALATEVSCAVTEITRKFVRGALYSDLRRYVESLTSSEASAGGPDAITNVALLRLLEQLSSGAGKAGSRWTVGSARAMSGLGPNRRGDGMTSLLDTVSMMEAFVTRERSSLSQVTAAVMNLGVTPSPIFALVPRSTASSRSSTVAVATLSGPDDAASVASSANHVVRASLSRPRTGAGASCEQCEQLRLQLHALLEDAMEKERAQHERDAETAERIRRERLVHEERLVAHHSAEAQTYQRGINQLKSEVERLTEGQRVMQAQVVQAQALARQTQAALDTAHKARDDLVVRVESLSEQLDVFLREAAHRKQLKDLYDQFSRECRSFLKDELDESITLREKQLSFQEVSFTFKTIEQRNKLAQVATREAKLSAREAAVQASECDLSNREAELAIRHAKFDQQQRTAEQISLPERQRRLELLHQVESELDARTRRLRDTERALEERQARLQWAEQEQATVRSGLVEQCERAELAHMRSVMRSDAALQDLLAAAPTAADAGVTSSKATSGAGSKVAMCAESPRQLSSPLVNADGATPPKQVVSFRHYGSPASVIPSLAGQLPGIPRWDATPRRESPLASLSPHSSCTQQSAATRPFYW